MKKFSSTTKVNSRRTSRNNKLRNLIVFSLVLLILFYIVPRSLGGVAALVFSPISQLESWLVNSGSILPSYFIDRQKLIDEISELERNLSYKSGTMNTIKRLQKDNADLRRLLNDESAERIAAGVISRPPTTPYDVLVIDKGRRDQVKQFAPVYVGIDQAIGYVAEVYEDTSIVALITTPGFESSVYILGPNIYTNAKGIGGGVLQVSVPQGIPLAVGDLVVVPSFDSGVYGSIDVVNSVATEPEQRGYVTFDLPTQSIRFVSVGLTPLSALTFEEVVTVVEGVKKDLTKVPVPEGVLVDIETATGTATSTVATTSSEVVNE